MNPSQRAWDKEGLDRLLAYYRRTGNRRVPDDYKDADGYALGKWVSRQRWYRRLGKLTPDRIRRLNRLEFVWEVSKSPKR